MPEWEGITLLNDFHITSSSLSALTSAWRVAMSNWEVLHFEVHCHDRHGMDWTRPGTQLTQMGHEKCVTETNVNM